MPHTQLDQNEDSILIHAPIWIIRKYDRRLLWRGSTFFLLEWYLLLVRCV